MKRNVTRRELATALIEAMADFALAFGWDDDLLIQRLVNVGITKGDFNLAGYSEFVKDFFKKREVK